VGGLNGGWWGHALPIVDTPFGGQGSQAVFNRLDVNWSVFFGGSSELFIGFVCFPHSSGGGG
jgi:hypothetical protein